jgi:hypothetical protein
VEGIDKKHFLSPEAMKWTEWVDTKFAVCKEERENHSYANSSGIISDTIYNIMVVINTRSYC